MQLGNKLIGRLFEEARLLGYEKMRLDTLPTMLAARKLYRKIGFYDITAYYDTPIEGTAFMEIAL